MMMLTFSITNLCAIPKYDCSSYVDNNSRFRINKITNHGTRNALTPHMPRLLPLLLQQVDDKN